MAESGPEVSFEVAAETPEVSLPTWLPTCRTCKQKPRTADRYHPNNALLHWPKRGICKETGRRTREEGNECGLCNVTRMRNFGGVSQPDLHAVMESNQDCYAKWEEKRTENCLQDDARKRKFEKCDLDTYRSEEAYTNIFQKGKAEPIGAFLEGKGYDLQTIGNEKKQMKFVTEELGLSVHSDNGELVVVTLTGEREVQVGTKQAAGKMKVHHHDGGQAAKASFAQYREGVHGISKNFCKAEEVEEKVREHRSKQALQEILSDVGLDGQKDPAAEEGGAESEDEDMGFDDHNLKPVTSSAGSGVPPALRGKGNRQCPSPRGRGRSLAEKQPDEFKVTSLCRQGDDGGAHPEIPVAKGKGRGKKGGRSGDASAKVEKLFEEKKESFSDSALWQGVVKRRAVQIVSKQLDEAAQKLVGVSEFAGLVEKIVNFSDSLLEKFDFFANLKKDTYFCTALPDDRAELLATFSPHLVAQILVHVTNAFLKDVETQDPRSRIENALRVASFAKSPCVSVHHFVKASSNANANQAAANAWKSADSLQQQLVSIVLDRLFKLKPEKAKECLAFLPKELDLGIEVSNMPADFDVGKPTLPDPMGGMLPKYSNRVAFDLMVARIVGSTNFEAEDQSTRFLAKAVCDQKSNCSEKLMQYFKAGSPKQWWHVMERSASSLVPPLALTSKAAELLGVVREIKVPDSGESALDLCRRGQFVGTLMEASGLMMSAGVAPDDSVVNLRTCLDNFDKSFRAHGGHAVQLVAKGVSFEAICSKSDCSLLALDQEPVFKNLLKLFKTFKVADWMMVNEAAAERISKAITDAAKLVQAVSAVEAKLTVETFTDAATRIYKFLQAKAHRVVKDELAEGIEATPQCLRNLGTSLESLEATSGMATGWCKSLVAKGLQGELLELSSSVRASLGKSVESMIRTVQVLNAYHLEEERRPAIFLEGAYTETTVMKDGILAFHDVCSAVLENLPSMDPALKILRGNVIATIARTAQLLDDSKKGVQLFYGDASKIQDAMKAGDEIEELVKKTANPKTVEKCIEGLKILGELESNALWLLSWKDDLLKDEEVHSSRALEKLQLASTAAPHCQQLSIALYALMVGDLIVNAKDDPAEHYADVQAFRNYASTALKLAKKDIPVELTSRFDKLSKDTAQKAQKAKESKKDSEIEQIDKSLSEPTGKGSSRSKKGQEATAETPKTPKANKTRKAAAEEKKAAKKAKK